MYSVEMIRCFATFAAILTVTSLVHVNIDAELIVELQSTAIIHCTTLEDAIYK